MLVQFGEVYHWFYVSKYQTSPNYKSLIFLMSKALITNLCEWSGSSLFFPSELKQFL